MTEKITDDKRINDWKNAVEKFQSNLSGAYFDLSDDKTESREIKISSLENDIKTIYNWSSNEKNILLTNNKILFYFKEAAKDNKDFLNNIKLDKLNKYDSETFCQLKKYLKIIDKFYFYGNQFVEQTKDTVDKWSPLKIQTFIDQYNQSVLTLKQTLYNIKISILKQQINVIKSNCLIIKSFIIGMSNCGLDPKNNLTKTITSYDGNSKFQLLNQQQSNFIIKNSNIMTYHINGLNYFKGNAEQFNTILKNTNNKNNISTTINGNAHYLVSDLDGENLIKDAYAVKIESKNREDYKFKKCHAGNVVEDTFTYQVYNLKLSKHSGSKEGFDLKNWGNYEYDGLKIDNDNYIKPNSEWSYFCDKNYLIGATRVYFEFAKEAGRPLKLCLFPDPTNPDLLKYRQYQLYNILIYSFLRQTGIKAEFTGMNLQLLLDETKKKIEYLTKFNENKQKQTENDKNYVNFKFFYINENYRKEQKFITPISFAQKINSKSFLIIKTISTFFNDLATNKTELTNIINNCSGPLIKGLEDGVGVYFKHQLGSYKDNKEGCGSISWNFGSQYNAFIICDYNCQKRLQNTKNLYIYTTYFYPVASFGKYDRNGIAFEYNAKATTNYYSKIYSDDSKAVDYYAWSVGQTRQGANNIGSHSTAFTCDGIAYRMVSLGTLLSWDAKCYEWAARWLHYAKDEKTWDPNPSYNEFRRGFFDYFLYYDNIETMFKKCLGTLYFTIFSYTNVKIEANIDNFKISKLFIQKTNKIKENIENFLNGQSQKTTNIFKEINRLFDGKKTEWEEKQNSTNNLFKIDKSKNGFISFKLYDSLYNIGTTSGLFLYNESSSNTNNTSNKIDTDIKFQKNPQDDSVYNNKFTILDFSKISGETNEPNEYSLDLSFELLDTDLIDNFSNALQLISPNSVIKETPSIDFSGIIQYDKRRKYQNSYSDLAKANSLATFENLKNHMYDLRNINFKNFRSYYQKYTDLGENAEKQFSIETLKDVIKSPSRSFYKNKDYLYFDSTFSLYSSNAASQVQPLIINQYQPNEQITPAGFFAFIDQMMEVLKQLGIVGVFNILGGFYTNKVIDKYSKSERKFTNI